MRARGLAEPKSQSLARIGAGKPPYKPLRVVSLAPLSPEQKGVRPFQENNNPIIDFDITANTKPSASFHGLKNLNLEQTPHLPDASSSHFQAIFDRKMSVCSQICDFSNAEADKQAKEIKKKLLEELLMFLDKEDQLEKISEDNISALIRMMKANICRHIPDFNRRFIYSDEVPNIPGFSWPHLQLVYTLLLKTLKCFPSNKEFNLDIVDELMPILNSPDANERTQVKFFLGALTLLHPEFHVQILIRLVRLLILSQNGYSIPYAMSAILELLLELFNSSTAKDEYIKLIFKMYVIPLVIDPFFSFFSDSYILLLNFFLNKDHSSANVVVDTILGHWPYARVVKQASFLKILISLIPKMSQREFASRIPKIFRIFADSTMSSSSTVAEAALGIWSSHECQAIMNIFAKKIFPIMVPAISYTSKEHWSHSIRQATAPAIDYIHRVDKQAADAMDNGFATKNCLEGTSVMKKWMQIVFFAQEHYQNQDFTGISDEINRFFIPPIPHVESGKTSAILDSYRKKQVVCPKGIRTTSSTVLVI